MNCCCSESNCDGSIGAAVKSQTEPGTTATAGAAAGVVPKQRKKAHAATPAAGALLITLLFQRGILFVNPQRYVGYVYDLLHHSLCCDHPHVCGTQSETQSETGAAL